MGHDPQPRVGQASDQAITVSDRVDVAGLPVQTVFGKGTLAGPSDSRVTHQAAGGANPAVTGPGQLNRPDLGHPPAPRQMQYRYARHRQLGTTAARW